MRLRNLTGLFNMEIKSTGNAPYSPNSMSESKTSLNEIVSILSDFSKPQSLKLTLIGRAKQLSKAPQLKITDQLIKDITILLDKTENKAAQVILKKLAELPESSREQTEIEKIIFDTNWELGNPLGLPYENLREIILALIDLSKPRGIELPLIGRVRLSNAPRFEITTHMIYDIASLINKTENRAAQVILKKLANLSDDSRNETEIQRIIYITNWELRNPLHLSFEKMISENKSFLSVSIKGTADRLDALIEEYGRFYQDRSTPEELKSSLIQFINDMEKVCWPKDAKHNPEIIGRIQRADRLRESITQKLTLTEVNHPLLAASTEIENAFKELFKSEVEVNPADVTSQIDAITLKVNGFKNRLLNLREELTYPLEQNNNFFRGSQNQVRKGLLLAEKTLLHLTMIQKFNTHIFAAPNNSDNETLETYYQEVRRNLLSEFETFLKDEKITGVTTCLFENLLNNSRILLEKKKDIQTQHRERIEAFHNALLEIEASIESTSDLSRLNTLKNDLTNLPKQFADIFHPKDDLKITKIKNSILKKEIDLKTMEFRLNSIVNDKMRGITEALKFHKDFQAHRELLELPKEIQQIATGEKNEHLTSLVIIQNKIKAWIQQEDEWRETISQLTTASDCEALIEEIELAKNGANANQQDIDLQLRSHFCDPLIQQLNHLKQTFSPKDLNVIKTESRPINPISELISRAENAIRHSSHNEDLLRTLNSELLEVFKQQINPAIRGRIQQIRASIGFLLGSITAKKK